MKKYLFTKIIFLFLLIVFSIQLKLISQNIKNEYIENSDTSWKYLGQPRPGMTPLRFPPDSLLATYSWMWHGTPVFSPDLKEMFWCKYNQITERGELVFIKYINGNWTSMQNAPFGNLSYFENNPQYSITGDTLFFVSFGQGRFVFRTVRTGSGWAEPSALNIPVLSGFRSGLDFSFARNGNIYFGMVDTAHPLLSDLYRSKYINGQYQSPENLGNIVNSDSGETSPYIDPYERFIIFASKRPGGYGLHDIFISKKNSDDTWNIPINLGPTINSVTEDVFPYITPDSMYFFYVTGKYQQIGYNPFWINAQYIYNLAAIGVKNLGNKIPEQCKLEQNYPNPFNPSTQIEFSIFKNNSQVKLVVFDISGREVSTLVHEQLNAGNYEVIFNGNNQSSGIYFYCLITESFTETKRMVLLK